MVPFKDVSQVFIVRFPKTNFVDSRLTGIR